MPRVSSASPRRSTDGAPAGMRDVRTLLEGLATLHFVPHEVRDEINAAWAAQEAHP